MNKIKKGSKVIYIHSEYRVLEDGATHVVLTNDTGAKITAKKELCRFYRF